jgi:hypothetical protein
LSLTLRAGLKMSMGGLAPKTLKKLNGDKFLLPSSSIVLAKHMGLGATALNKKLCKTAVFTSPGMILIKYL